MDISRIFVGLEPFLLKTKKWEREEELQNNNEVVLLEMAGYVLPHVVTTILHTVCSILLHVG